MCGGAADAVAVADADTPSPSSRSSRYKCNKRSLGWLERAGTICWKHKQYLMAMAVALPFSDCNNDYNDDDDDASTVAAASCVSTHAWRMRRNPENPVENWTSTTGIIIHLIRLERIYQLGTFITAIDRGKKMPKLAYKS